jgi:hypothetical protein
MVLTTPTQLAHQINTIVAHQWPGSHTHRLTQHIIQVLPAALRHLTHNTADGWATATNQPATNSGYHDPISNAIIQREPTTHTHQQITNHLQIAHQAALTRNRPYTTRTVYRTLKLLDSCQPPLDPKHKQAMMCATIHPQDTGTEPWVDPLCDKVSDVGRSGLCEACYRRRFRAVNR